VSRLLQDLERRRLTAAAAGQLLRVERRQVYRLLKAYRIEGPTGLISKRRGRRGNRRKPKALRRAVQTVAYMALPSTRSCYPWRISMARRQSVLSLSAYATKIGRSLVPAYHGVGRSQCAAAQPPRQQIRQLPAPPEEHRGLQHRR
jgi:Helix-turn-helix domain